MKKREKQQVIFRKGEIIVPNILVRSFFDWATLPVLKIQKVKADTYEAIKKTGEVEEIPRSYAHRIYMPIDHLFGQLFVEYLQATKERDETLMRSYREAIEIVRLEQGHLKKVG